MRPGTIYVPTFADQFVDEPQFKQTRLSYFRLDCGEPYTVEQASGPRALPLLMMDIDGVIISGLDGKPLLDTSDAIEELFDYIDTQTPYMVSTDYFWLPTQTIKDYVDHDLQRGDVLRVVMPLFVQANSGTINGTDLATASSSRDNPPIFFSAKETLAFRSWTDRRIATVRHRYVHMTDLNLRSRSKGKGKQP